MKPEKPQEKSSARKKRNRSILLLIPIAFILVIALLFFLSSNQNNGPGSTQSAANHTGVWSKITRTVANITGHMESGNTNGKKPETNTPNNSSAKTGQSNMSMSAGGENATTSTASKTTTAANATHPGSSPGNGNLLAPSKSTLQTILAGTPQSCQQAADKINAFYSHLDAQPYIQNFHLGEKSSVYFSQLIEKLLKNPPVITRETDDLYTVLSNTSHFYRIIGKRNITIIKTILDKEKPYIENTLAAFYVLTEDPGCLQKSFSISVPPYSIYDYAGFFLNTMGGRLYLFRRDSVSRMTVTYYAILVVDKANRMSKNRDGIQIKQAIDSLISEMENSGHQLSLKNRYLDKLYDLKERYQ